MAKPIPLDLPPRDPREHLRRRLEEAPVEHAEALLAAYEVLQGLHDRGVFEALRGALGSGEKVLEILVDAAKTPEAMRAIRNLMVLGKIAGQFDPEVLAGVAKAVEVDFSRGTAREPLGLWELTRKLRGKDTRRALTALLGVLESMGKSLGGEGGSHSKVAKGEEGP